MRYLASAAFFQVGKMCGIQQAFYSIQEYRGKRDAASPIFVLNKRSMNAQLKLWLPVILGLWLDQVLHDVAAGIDPDPATAALSLSDGNLMFEFLLGGVKINPDNNVFLLDEELASMRKGREFLSQIVDDIPKHQSSMELMAGVQRSEKPGVECSSSWQMSPPTNYGEVFSSTILKETIKRS
ncbi:hypothetical protein XENOCAPTIV_030573 [Xenoophorus captivus]|uniref:Uncharacterized protein n=1 Tax=Xenoophorus captivus TaxID=1517983 RepID=A0ABV0R3W3_9TELE